jgi:hypothetical protein
MADDLPGTDTCVGDGRWAGVSEIEEYNPGVVREVSYAGIIGSGIDSGTDGKGWGIEGLPRR